MHLLRHDYGMTCTQGEAMKVITFTDTMIRKLKPAERKYTRGEGNGFTLRVMPSGVKTWLYVYAFQGKRCEMNLGGYPAVTLETARGRFDAARVRIKNGFDPMEEKELAATTRRNAHTVSDLIEDYIGKYAKLKKSSWKEDERILHKDVLPVWKSRKAKDITRRDVMQLLDGMQGRGNGIITNTFKIVRRMFAYAVKREIISITPCYAFEKGDELPTTKSRERTLSLEEIKLFWLGLDKAAISGDIQRILKLILLTGQRSGEVASMHRSEISGRWWEFTPKETKITKEIPRKQRVYLTDTALGLIGDDEGFVFKSRAPITPNADGTLPEPRHITERAISSAVRGNLLGYEPKNRVGVKPSGSLTKKKPFVVAEGKRLNIDHFTPHDLRRTCATEMSNIGISDAVVDAVLAHLKKGEIRTYNKNKYDKEKQQALEAWGRKLHSIISGDKDDNVILFQKRAIS